MTIGADPARKDKMKARSAPAGSRPFSASRSRLINKGLPAKAEKH